MKISELIKQLEQYKKTNGDLQVIIQQEEPFSGVSTVETLFVRPNWNRKDEKAILLDWRI